MTNKLSKNVGVLKYVQAENSEHILNVLETAKVKLYRLCSRSTDQTFRFVKSSFAFVSRKIIACDVISQSIVTRSTSLSFCL